MKDSLRDIIGKITPGLKSITAEALYGRPHNKSPETAHELSPCLGVPLDASIDEGRRIPIFGLQ